MKLLPVILIVLAVSLAARSQDDLHTRRGQEVRAIVEGFGPKATKVTLLTRELIVFRGKVIKVRERSLDLKFSGRVITIAYDNVLELEGSGKFVSFVPDRAERNHGTWEDVRRIYPGTKILVVYADGKSGKGFSNSATKTHLIMVDNNGRKRVDVPSPNILAVYGLIGGYGGVKAGASKGAEGIANSRHALLGGVFAGIGALAGLVKSDGRPILVYSK